MKINWKQSSVIINDKAFDLMADETVTTVSGRLATSVNTVRTEGVAVTSSVPGLRQIPPRSFIIYESNVWITRGFLKIPKEEYARVQSILDDGTKVNVREIGFREDESPLRFRTYLSLEYEGEGEQNGGFGSFVLCVRDNEGRAISERG